MTVFNSAYQLNVRKQNQFRILQSKASYKVPTGTVRYQIYYQDRIENVIKRPQRAVKSAQFTNI